MTFSDNTKSAATGVLLSFLIVICACFILVRFAKAEEPCQTKADLQDLQDIKKNQQGLQETRPAYTTVATAVREGRKIEGDAEKLIPAYNDFLDFKTWNEAEAEALASRGCEVDWSTLSLRPLASRP